MEIGSIQIGGSIQTIDIEKGIKRIEFGFKEISTKAKSVESDFERISARGSKLVTIFGGLAIAGTGALIALTKGAPALAGAMAKINVSMLKLKMAAGEALKPTFDAAAGVLNKIANWVDEHPDLFRGIVNSIMGLAAATAIIKVGGWVYKAWEGFFGLFRGLTGWTGWATLGNIFKTIGSAIASLASKVGSAIGSILSWFSKLGSKIGGLLTGEASSSIVSSVMGTTGIATAIGIGPLINTYQREITGKPGFLDKQLQAYNDYMFNQNLKKWSRNQSELDMRYVI